MKGYVCLSPRVSIRLVWAYAYACEVYGFLLCEGSLWAFIRLMYHKPGYYPSGSPAAIAPPSFRQGPWRGDPDQNSAHRYRMHM